MLWCLFMVWLAVAGGPEVVGPIGGTLDLPAGWSRQGPDEESVLFRHASGPWIRVEERRGTWFTEEDHRRWIRDALVGIGQMAWISEKRPLTEVVYEERRGVGHAWQRWEARHESGERAVLDVHTIGSGALGYVIIGVATGERTNALDFVSSSMARRLVLPEQVRKRKDVDRTWEVEVGRVHLSQTYPADLLTRSSGEDMGDTAVKLRSFDNALHYMVFVEHGEGTDTEHLGAAMGVVAHEQWDVQREETWELEVAGVKGSGATQVADFQGDVWTMRFAILPLADDHYLDVRMSSVGPAELREPQWQRLIDGLSARVEPPLDAFPDVVRDDGSELTPVQLALLDAGQELERVDVQGSKHWLAGGRVVVVSNTGVVLFDPATGQQHQRHGELGWGSALVGYDPVQDQVIVADRQSRLLAFGAEQTRELEFSASDGVRLSDGSLVLLRERKAEPLGGVDLDLSAGWMVVQRQPDGQERTVAVLERWVPTELAVEQSGEHALLAARPATERWGSPVLLRLDLGDGSVREVGRWSEITAAVSAGSGGYTLVGAPEPGRPGVYHVDGDGTATLRISGEHLFAREQADGSVDLLTRVGLPRLQWRQARVVRLPAAAVAQHGPGFSPWSPAAMAALAGRVLQGASADEVLADADTIRARAAAAREAWDPARLGPVPTTDDDVDGLVRRLASVDEADAGAVLLLDLLVIDRLLERGAIWLPAPPDGLSTGTARDAQSLHAAGFLPLEIVRSSLQDSEGWWNPVETITSQGDGRMIVLGRNAEQVRARCRELDRGLPPDLQDAQALRRWLDKDPDNQVTRVYVGRRLAAAGEPELLAELTAFDDPAMVGADLAALYFGARLQLEHDPQDLVEELRAVLEHTRDPTLLVQLGVAYSRLDHPLARRRARACLEFVQQTYSYSPVADQVDRLLSELEE